MISEQYLKTHAKKLAEVRARMAEKLEEIQR